MAERNCLLLDSCLDKLYIVLQVWLFLFSFLFFFFRGCSLFEVFFNFGRSCFRPKFVVLSFVVHYAQLLPRLVSVLGLDRCFQSDSLLYLVFRLYSYWPFVFRPSVDIMPCAFRPAYIGLKYDWKAEEMEGERAASLFTYGHPSSSYPRLTWLNLGGLCWA